MISKLNTFLFNNVHHDVYEVKQKINEVIATVNQLESILLDIMERAKRVKRENHIIEERPIHEPLTNFGFRPYMYCTCGKNTTAPCPIHTVETGHI